uniref:helix-turn-helix domain-containing protein n=1 Tax=Faecalibacterium sp. TaxID=1971605 RepID=UPI00402557AB
MKVVETMRAEHLSCPEAAKRFGVQSKTQVARWERICLEESKEALLLECRFY